MNNEGFFKGKIDDEIKLIKKRIYKEEIYSFVFASMFAVNIACLIVSPLTFYTIANVCFAGMFLRKFRPVVKQQFILHSYLKALYNQRSEKVWSVNDK